MLGGRRRQIWLWGAALVGLATAVRMVWVLSVPTVPVSDFAMYRESANYLSEFGRLDHGFIYMPGFVALLAWIKDLGGLAVIERRNRTKAATLYAAIDADPGFYRAPVEKGSRSVMNVVFHLATEELEKRFVDEAKKQGMVGLKGHRSVGGIRVSLYNAVEPAWVDELASFMEEFAKRG